MNEGRSGAEWNPVSIVALACERLVHSHVCCIVFGYGMPSFEANGLAANVV